MFRYLFCTFLCLIFGFQSGKTQDTLFINQDFKSEFFAPLCLLNTQNSNKFDISLFINQGKEIVDIDQRLAPDTQNFLSVYIKNNTEFDLKFLCFLHNMQIDKTRLYVFIGDSMTYQSPVNGSTIPAALRPNRERTIALPIILKSNSLHLVYIQVYRKEFGITVSPHLVNPLIGIDFRWTDYLAFSIIGCNIILIFICLIIYYYSRRKRIIIPEIKWFAIYFAVSSFYVAASSGFGSLYVWSSFPWFELNSTHFFESLNGAILIYCCKLALEISVKSEAISYWFDIMVISFLISSLPGFFLYEEIVPIGLYNLILGFVILGFLACLFSIIFLSSQNAFKNRESAYYWFLCLFIYYFTTTILVFANENGLIQYNFKTHTLHLAISYFPQFIATLFYLTFRLLKTIEEKQYKFSALRKEISHNIHDEVGSSLTKISLLSHSLSNNNKLPESLISDVRKMKEDAVKTNSILRDLIFAISPKSDKFDSFQAYIREITNAYFINSKAKIHFELPKSSINPIIDSIAKSQFINLYKAILEHLFPRLIDNEFEVIFKIINSEKLELKLTFRNQVPLQTREFSSQIKKLLSRSNLFLDTSSSIGGTNVISIVCYHQLKIEA